MSADRVAEALALLDGRERWARTSTSTYGPNQGATHPSTVLRECAGWRAVLRLADDLNLALDPFLHGDKSRHAAFFRNIVCDALLGPEETA